MIREGPPLPPGVQYEWQRLSRRRGGLQVWNDLRLIFMAETDGREWTPEDVCSILRSRPEVSA